MSDRVIPQAIVVPEVWNYIYIVTQDGRDSPCKIGFSGCPERRLQALNCGRDTRVILRACIPCPLGIPDWGSSNPHYHLRQTAKSIERAIHLRLKIFKIRGEWFDVELSEAVYIAKLAVEKAS